MKSGGDEESTVSVLLKLATLNLLNSSETPSVRLLATVSASQLALEVADKLTASSEIDHLQTTIITRVCEFVTSHPSASERQLIDFIRAQFEEYRCALTHL